MKKYIDHFNVKIIEKPSNNINKEYYLQAKPEGMKGWTEEHYRMQIFRAGYNYDLNMEYFSSLSFDEFNQYLEKFCKKNKLKECKDLNLLKNVSGVYMLVLDNFKQVYIGKAENQSIFKRIKQHWNKKMSLERLVFGWNNIFSSIISINSFGALDTTRIFYIKTYKYDEIEAKLVDSFNSKYRLNRVPGGYGSPETYTDDEKTTLLAISANGYKRDFSKFVDLNELKQIMSENEFNNYIEKYSINNQNK